MRNQDGGVARHRHSRGHGDGRAARYGRRHLLA